jgi:hypothetical protein
MRQCREGPRENGGPPARFQFRFSLDARRRVLGREAMEACGHRGIGAVTLLPAWQSRDHGPSNKRMQLTKLRAAPVWQAEVPPCAPAGQLDGGTASQLIRSVRPTVWRVRG